MSYNMKKMNFSGWQHWMDYINHHKSEIRKGTYSEKELVYKLFEDHMGRPLPPSSNDPKSFNEILNYMKYDPYIIREYSKYADKYNVRKYVQNKISNEYLVPLYFHKKALSQKTYTVFLALLY